MNQVTVEQGGTQVMGFADTGSHMQALYAALTELKALEGDASLDEVVAALAVQGPELAPLVDYLKRNHVGLSALGASFVSIVIALLAWLLPQEPDSDEPQQPVPAGVTYGQMEQLIEELRTGVGGTPRQSESSDRERKSNGPQRSVASRRDDHASKRQHVPDDNPEN